MKKQYQIEPEVSGGIGSNSILNYSTKPPVVEKLNYEFQDWLGDDIIESFPVYLCSENLSIAFQDNNLTGFILDDCEITKSELFMDLNPEDLILPKFYWLKIIGNDQDDFFLSPKRILILSQRAFDILQNFNINYCDVEEYNQ